MVLKSLESGMLRRLLSKPLNIRLVGLNVMGFLLRPGRRRSREQPVDDGVHFGHFIGLEEIREDQDPISSQSFPYFI
jgi:hypothetical protein